MRSKPSPRYAATVSKLARRSTTHTMSANGSRVSQMPSTSWRTKGRSPRGSDPMTSARGRARMRGVAPAGRGRAGEQRAVEDEALPEPVAKAPELLLVVQELPGQAVQRRADQERTGDGPELLPQARRDQRPVQHLAARLRFLRERRAFRAPQQRL